MTMHVNSFAGGVALLGSADTRQIDELTRADSVEIGPRGALICASEPTLYTSLLDSTGQPWRVLRQIFSFFGMNYAEVMAVGEGMVAAALCYIYMAIARNNAPNLIATPAGYTFIDHNGVAPAPKTEGVIVTSAIFPGVFPVRYSPAGGASFGPTQYVNCCLINIGAREGFAPTSAPGLYVFQARPPGFVPYAYEMFLFDALGTGSSGSLPVATGTGGTNGHQLYFRGIVLFGSFVFGWGFDSADAINGDGPARVMFCNLGNPLKWGNDNIAPVIPPAAATNRLFTDSDAIILGDAGEIIRAGCRALGKLFFGTNRAVHFIQGYGRDTFITNGAIPVMKAFNVVGPYAMIEGPDRLLYGVCDQGLWRYSGVALPDPLFLKLWDFTGHSTGYWELIWTDPGLGASFPGRTNQDLVWMANDYDKQQVIVGIPWCNALAGSGKGIDTVVIKYHVNSGGFTRQVFLGVQYSCAAYLRREGQKRETRLWGAGNNAAEIYEYGAQASAAQSAPMPSRLPAVGFGPYSPFGPDGQGVVRRVYLTISWEEPASLPIVFRVLTETDQASVNDYLLTIDQNEPASPADGDCWLDTSNTDQSIGNAVAGIDIPATGGFLLKTRNSGAWQTVAGQGAIATTRASLTLPVKRRMGTHYTVNVETVAAAGRFQIEGLGLEPGGGTAAA